MGETSRWIEHLDDAAISEIDAALARLEERDLEIPFGAEDFALPGLAHLLDCIPNRLEDGYGFVLLRGLPRHRYSVEQCQMIYWGIGVNLGTPISQKTRGHLPGHVRDEGKNFDDPTARGYQTSAKMDFLADQLPVDILGLFCMGTSKSGGESGLVSADTVHNVLLEERLDLLEVLYQPFDLDWRGEESPGEPGWYTSPMFSYAGGKITSRITSRQCFDTFTRFGDDLALADIQREALDAVQEISNRPALRLSMTLQEGDMRFLNNHALLRARTEFEDHAEPELKRHLLRMWIALPPERRRRLAPRLAERYRVVESGGIPSRAGS